MSDGINKLSQVANRVASDAASDLNEIANKQQESLDNKKQIRDVQGNLEAYKNNPPSTSGPIQQGISAAKDVFETKPGNPLFEANTQTGELKFGDGVQGKIPGTSPNIVSRYDSGLGKSGNTGGAIDPNALVQYVLRESYLQTTEDLRFYADKVKHFNDMKKELREGIRDLVNEESLEKLDRVSAGKSGNAIEELFLVMRESIKDTNEDKKYYLELLQKMNQTSSAIAAQFESISDASTRLSKKEKDDDD